MLINMKIFNESLQFPGIFHNVMIPLKHLHDILK